MEIQTTHQILLNVGEFGKDVSIIIVNTCASIVNISTHSCAKEAGWRLLKISPTPHVICSGLWMVKAAVDADRNKTACNLEDGGVFFPYIPKRNLQTSFDLKSSTLPVVEGENAFYLQILVGGKINY